MTTRPGCGHDDGGGGCGCGGVPVVAAAAGAGGAIASWRSRKEGSCMLAQQDAAARAVQRSERLVMLV